MTIGQAFDESIAYYDRWMKRALHCYDDTFAIAQEMMPFEPDRAIHVLDLGAGTGLFSSFVLAKYPQATFVLYDLGEQMLQMAGQRFASHEAQFEMVVGDYRQIEYDGEFDLVVSSLSIHHLTDEEKAALCVRIYLALKPGGVFLNFDQIKGQTPYMEQYYWDWWLARVRQGEATEQQVQESIHRRKTYDKDALLCDQLRWLKEAGFAVVDCVYKHHFLGLFFALKPI